MDLGETVGKFLFSATFPNSRSQYEHPGSAIGYWPETCLGHVYAVLEPAGSARLKFCDDRYYEFICFDVPKVVRSPGYDHGHDEGTQNG